MRPRGMTGFWAVKMKPQWFRLPQSQARFLSLAARNQDWHRSDIAPGLWERSCLTVGIDEKQKIAVVFPAAISITIEVRHDGTAVAGEETAFSPCRTGGTGFWYEKVGMNMGWKTEGMSPDIEKTQAYYNALGPENICDCAYCRNYCARVKKAYPEAARYLASLGVDIEKPFELFLPEPDEDGDLEYSMCQYIVFGTCRKEYHHQIGEVKFGVSDCHPNTKIEEEHFVLDVYPMKLKFEAEDDEEDLPLRNLMENKNRRSVHCGD